MQRRNFPAKSLILGTLFAGLVALSLMPILATAAGSKAKQAVYNKAVLHATIAMSSKGMVITPATLKPGNHLLTIKNTTSEPRGVEMIGIDSEQSPTVRYTKILKPGQSEAFRWFFATSKTVYVRDILNCSHVQKSCMMVTFGQMRKAIDVK